MNAHAPNPGYAGAARDPSPSNEHGDAPSPVGPGVVPKAPSKRALRRRRGRAEKARQKHEAALKQAQEELERAAGNLPAMVRQLLQPSSSASKLTPTDRRCKAKVLQAMVRGIVQVASCSGAAALTSGCAAVVSRVKKASADRLHDTGVKRRDKKRRASDLAAAAKRQKKKQKKRTTQRGAQPTGGRRLTKQLSKKELARIAKFSEQQAAHRRRRQRRQAGSWEGPRLQGKGGGGRGRRGGSGGGYGSGRDRRWGCRGGSRW